MQRLEVRGKRETNWTLPATLLVAVLVAGAWFGGDVVRRFTGKASPTVSSRPAARSEKVTPAVSGPRFARRATLREFMKKDLGLTPTQIRQYQKYRLYYQEQIKRADRIENRNRGVDIYKLAQERDRMLVVVLGQRSMDSITWWARGSKYRVSLDDWLREREGQRQRQRSASLRKIASR